MTYLFQLRQLITKNRLPILLVMLALMVGGYSLAGANSGQGQPPLYEVIRHEDTLREMTPGVMASSVVDMGAYYGCPSPGDTGQRIMVIYATLSNESNRFTERYPQVLKALKGADGIFNFSAGRWAGNHLHLRYLTDDSCNIAILNLVVPLEPAAAGTVPQATVSAGKNPLSVLLEGIHRDFPDWYRRTDRKYVIFTELSGLCGIGNFLLDDRRYENENDRYPSDAVIGASCYYDWVVAHEITHMLGAVFTGAPHSDGGYHCTDEFDLMCKASSVKPVCTGEINDTVLDCNGDDYFSFTPSGWLSEHRDVAESNYLVRTIDSPKIFIPKAER